MEGERATLADKLDIIQVTVVYRFLKRFCFFNTIDIECMFVSVLSGKLEKAACIPHCTLSDISCTYFLLSIQSPFKIH